MKDRAIPVLIGLIHLVCAASGRVPPRIKNVIACHDCRYSSMADIMAGYGKATGTDKQQGADTVCMCLCH
jgi:hypothetical protein